MVTTGYYPLLLGGEVAILDSKYSHKLTPSFTHQLAQIYRKYLDSQEDTGCETLLSLRIPMVQQQSGGSDCGIFAIAFAVHLLRGDNIEDIDFDQEKMRSHLNSCFWRKKMLPFPTLSTKGRRITTYFPYFQLEVYCHCKMPETYGDMVECEECEEWYHIRCVNANTMAKWLCKYCVESGHSR